MSNKKFLLEEERGAAPPLTEPPLIIGHCVRLRRCSGSWARPWCIYPVPVYPRTQEDHYDATRTWQKVLRKLCWQPRVRHHGTANNKSVWLLHWTLSLKRRIKIQDDWTLPAAAASYCKHKITCGANWIRGIFIRFLISGLSLRTLNFH